MSIVGLESIFLHRSYAVAAVVLFLAAAAIRLMPIDLVATQATISAGHVDTFGGPARAD
jgi:hypothetical protein